MRRYELLPGLSAAAWKRRQWFSYVYLAISSFLLLFYLVLLSGRTGLGQVVAVVVMLVWGATTTTFIAVTEVGFRRKRTAELRSGYTSLSGELVNVDQVDPITGDVVRDAGRTV